MSFVLPSHDQMCLNAVRLKKKSPCEYNNVALHRNLHNVHHTQNHSDFIFWSPDG